MKFPYSQQALYSIMGLIQPESISTYEFVPLLVVCDCGKVRTGDRRLCTASAFNDIVLLIVVNDYTYS